MDSSPLDEAVGAFANELATRRAERGWSKKQLAIEMGFDPSYVSHVEGRRHRPTEDFARRAEAALAAGGAIFARYQAYDQARRGQRPPIPVQRDGNAVDWNPRGTGLYVEDEVASVYYAQGVYHCRVRRRLFNAGPDPITRYPVRVAVDRYPGDTDRSNRHYREHPLTWEELTLTAYAGDDLADPMRITAIHDRDSFKEVWLLFENDQSRFPVYPGEYATIEYAYRVGNDKWGPWFQRSVRLPTRRLTIQVDLPATLHPAVWGVQTSLAAESAPLRSPLTHRRDGDRARYEWSTDDPPLHTRYRLEWRFRADGGSERARPRLYRRASDWMASIGVVQRGAPLLRQPARPLELPAQQQVARDVVTRLENALDRIGDLHTFGKGMGLAAPQLGVGWAVAIVLPPGDEAKPIVLLNPRVVAASAETDDQYEGCLSFFDVRGLVTRPLQLEVEHSSPTGTRMITVFERGLARLVAHEIDHLDGRLYLDRMPPGAGLVPVEEYRGSGQSWRY